MGWPFNTCRRVRGRLPLYLDGQLAAADQERVKTHLERCPGCREEVESLRATVSLLKRVPQASVPRSFALRRAPAPVPIRRPLPAPLGFAAAAATVLLAFVLAGDAANLWEPRAATPVTLDLAVTARSEPESAPVAAAETVTPTPPAGTPTEESYFRAMGALPAPGEKPTPEDAGVEAAPPGPPPAIQKSSKGPTAPAATGDAAQTPAAEPSAAPELQEAGAGTPAILEDTALAPAATPAASEDNAQPAEAPSLAAPPEEQPAPPTWLRLLESVLAGTAGGLLALLGWSLARRRGTARGSRP